MSDATRRAARPTNPRTPSGAHEAAVPGSDETQRRLEAASSDSARQRYVLRLYVTGMTPGSSRAIERVRQLCDERLAGRYALEVIDIYQKPALAKDEQIIATPTLIRVLPAPLRRFIGDLSKVEKTLFGLDLREKS